MTAYSTFQYFTYTIPVQEHIQKNTENTNISPQRTIPTAAAMASTAPTLNPGTAAALWVTGIVGGPAGPEVSTGPVATGTDEAGVDDPTGMLGPGVIRGRLELMALVHLEHLVLKVKVLVEPVQPEDIEGALVTPGAVGLVAGAAGVAVGPVAVGLAPGP